MNNFIKLSEKKILLPKKLINFGKVFTEHGFEAFLVGGAVRDIFLNKTADDWDVATNATAEEVMSLFKFVIPTGIAHGTVTVHYANTEIEVTTFRADGKYTDGRHPDQIKYVSSIEEDLGRRDFTINAIAVSLSTGKVVDPYDGKTDIKKQIIRCVGNPHERFLEDGLRPIRALRFASKLNFKIDENTYSQIFEDDVKQKISSISIERFRDEFEKILKSEKPSVGLKLMEETGILQIFIPEFQKCKNCIQSDYREFHKFDVLNHLFYSCDGAPKEKLNVRLAALFHDIGKPDSKKIIDQTVLDGEKKDGSKKIIKTLTFYNHEIFSEKITRTIMIRLKFSNEMIDNVCHLVKEHMFHYESNWTSSAIRRFIIRVGKENLDDLYDLRLADMYGMWNEKVDIRYSDSIKLLLELKERIEKELSKKTALTLKDLAINGKDLISIGIPSGKKLGSILNELMNIVLEDPSQNNKEVLLKIAENLAK